MPEPRKFHQRLAGRTAIVTGAGCLKDDGVGIGKAIAILFAMEGAQICAVDMYEDRAEETRALIAGRGGDAFVVTGDITAEETCEKVVAATIAQYGKIDILVNNVGFAVGGGPLETLDMALWDRMMSVNLRSMVLLTKQAIPHLLKTSGAIVNLSSVASLRATSDAGGYGPSKAGVNSFTRELATMYGRRGVRANAVAPGHINTPMVVDQVRDLPGVREKRRLAAPLGIEGDAWDVAAAALFLASDEARFVSGTCLPVDGGLLETLPLISHRFLSEGGA